MADRTKIEWTDATWNPVTGCTRVSPGCERCYINWAPPFRIEGRHFVDAAGQRSHAIGSSTGVRLHPERLDQPIRWLRPRRIFVCSLADLFPYEGETTGKRVLHMTADGVVPWGVARRSDVRASRMVRVGKRAAGRALDGRTWDQYPIEGRSS